MFKIKALNNNNNNYSSTLRDINKSVRDILNNLFSKIMESTTGLIIISKLYQEGKITDEDRERLKGKCLNSAKG